MMASTRSGGGVHLFVGLQVLGHQRLLIALLLVMRTIGDVHCITTNALAPAPQIPNTTEQKRNFTIFQQYEADALNAIRDNWIKRNPQLSTILNWSPNKLHPCNSSALDYYNVTEEFEGAWLGVFCFPVPQENATGNYREVSVTRLELYGSNPSCDAWPNYGTIQCGFDGIKGELPSEISKLRNLSRIYIRNHPELKGPVPLEIWQMPNLTSIDLSNNSLTGALPASNDFNAFSKLESIDLSHNKFNGSLQASSRRTLFSPVLQSLDLSSNQLVGPVDFQGLNSIIANIELDLSNNSFSGTFSTGAYWNPYSLFLSNNEFTSIRFANYSGPRGASRGSGILYMPALHELNVANNKLSGPFPAEILQMPGLTRLNVDNNKLSGPFPAEILQMPSLTHLYLSGNYLSGSVDFRAMKNPGFKRLRFL